MKHPSTPRQRRILLALLFVFVAVAIEWAHSRYMRVAMTPGLYCADDPAFYILGNEAVYVMRNTNVFTFQLTMSNPGRSALTNIWYVFEAPRQLAPKFRAEGWDTNEIGEHFTLFSYPPSPSWQLLYPQRDAKWPSVAIDMSEHRALTFWIKGGIGRSLAVQTRFHVIIDDNVHPNFYCDQDALDALKFYTQGRYESNAMFMGLRQVTPSK
jgi:hypothetical protein